MITKKSICLRFTDTELKKKWFLLEHLNARCIKHLQIEWFKSLPLHISDRIRILFQTLSPNNLPKQTFLMVTVYLFIWLRWTLDSELSKSCSALGLLDESGVVGGGGIIWHKGAPGQAVDAMGESLCPSTGGWNQSRLLPPAHFGWFASDFDECQANVLWFLGCNWNKRAMRLLKPNFWFLQRGRDRWRPNKGFAQVLAHTFNKFARWDRGSGWQGREMGGQSAFPILN